METVQMLIQMKTKYNLYQYIKKKYTKNLPKNQISMEGSSGENYSQ